MKYDVHWQRPGDDEMLACRKLTASQLADRLASGCRHGNGPFIVHYVDRHGITEKTLRRIRAYALVGIPLLALVAGIAIGRMA